MGSYRPYYTVLTSRKQTRSNRSVLNRAATVASHPEPNPPHADAMPEHGVDGGRSSRASCLLPAGSRRPSVPELARGARPVGWGGRWGWLHG